ncbi:uncharacterized protein At4g15970 [Arachis hypogaea]|uniref:uncharacterized protein At4g15970 n=1 Tax=Arachis hypogaea TaxID=3818 RepID=UPI000DECDF4E|nr:uncharacterized protein At4g15970 [Arachis hypogaea]QHO43432.1 uncharacterized protein DS421_5g162790 [Arachis hypogaea]
MKDSGSSGGDAAAGGGGSHLLVRRVMQMTMVVVAFVVVWILMYNSSSPFAIPVFSRYITTRDSTMISYDPELESVLRNASMENKTVIITTLNDAWAEPNSIFDIFLKSFHLGIETERLLKHLVVITLDQKAHARCQALHPHCYQLETKGDNFTKEAFFMTQDYLKMMWRRIQFLGSVLEMGYSFVFTDTDIMWLRNPFNEFYNDGDFQIACDFYNGNSNDLNNLPNGGFNYVKSNEKTIWFYKFWLNSRKAYPKMHDQDVFNKIKMNPLIQNIKLKIRFLGTMHFGGFCQPSKEFNQVCTMHANCCVGLDNKVNDLKILLDDWSKYMALPNNTKLNVHPSWTVPQSCNVVETGKTKADDDDQQFI